MGQVSRNVGDFNKTSTGTTVYGATITFNVPENAGITGCTTTFTTHVNSGSFQDKAFLINGQRASDSWISTTGVINHSLLVTGSNTFRVSMKAQAGKTATWSISNIQLHITYNDPSGSSLNGGSISLSKTVIDAGTTFNVSLTSGSGGVYRDVYVYGPNTGILIIPFQGQQVNAESRTVTIPLSWCASYAPNSNSFTGTVVLVAYLAGGVDVAYQEIPITIKVPSSVVPTIGSFTPTRVQNGVDASITDYVQGYSGVTLTMSGEAGAYGSTITARKITGAGFSSSAASATFTPIKTAGTLKFTAEVTDSRGRKATATTTITVLEYTPPSGINLSAFRSDNAGNEADEGTYAALSGKRVFSPLGTQNTATIKGCVYEKNTTPPALSNMSDDVTLILGGSLSIEKAYTAFIEIADKITSVAYIIEIPASIVGLHILPGATGAGICRYGVSGKTVSAFPIFFNDDQLETTNEKAIFNNTASANGLYIKFENPVGTIRMFYYVEIRGNGYVQHCPIFTAIEGYRYTTTSWVNCYQKNYGCTLAAAKFMDYNGYLSLFVPNIQGYQVLYVSVWGNNGAIARKRMSNYTVSLSAEPPGTNVITCTVV